MNKIIQCIAIVAISVVLVLNSCVRHAEPEVFLIPRNYVGVVVVVFDQRNGAARKYSEGRRVYEVPENGILLTKFPRTIHGLIDQKYYYVDERGSRLREIFAAESDDSDSHLSIMNGTYRTFTLESIHKKFEYRSFAIGEISDRDSLADISSASLNKIMAR